MKYLHMEKDQGSVKGSLGEILDLRDSTMH